MRKDDTAFRKASHVMMRLSHEGSLAPPGTSLCAVGETKQGIRRHIKLNNFINKYFQDNFKTRVLGHQQAPTSVLPLDGGDGDKANGGLYSVQVYTC